MEIIQCACMHATINPLQQQNLLYSGNIKARMPALGVSACINQLYASNSDNRDSH